MSHGSGSGSFSMLYIVQIKKLIHFDVAAAPARKLMRLQLRNTILLKLNINKIKKQYFNLFSHLFLNKGTRKQFSKAVVVEPEPLGCE
jgi:hypothetical protein